jgi:hypothetical protein
MSAPQVDQPIDRQSLDAPVLAGNQAVTRPHRSSVAGALEMFASTLDPFHGTADPPRGESNQHLLLGKIELAPECPADEVGRHPHG